MKFTHTLEAAQSQEVRTWAVADGLVLDFKEAGVGNPTTAHYKEGAEALKTKGLDYNPKTLQDYWRVASTFTPSRRRKTATVKVYAEIVSPLWARLGPETRSNDLVSYATQFFAEVAAPRSRELPGAYKARAWAKAQAASLDAERKAREEAEAKRLAKESLKEAEAAMAAHIEAGDMNAAREVLVTVNALRRRLGMDLLKLDEEEVEVEVDEEATEQAREEDEEKDLHEEALAEIEAAIAKVGIQIAYLGNTYLRYQEHLTEDDLAAYAEEIELEEGRLALIRAKFGGQATDDALAAALAEWADS